MQVDWIKDLDPTEKKQFENNFKNSKIVLDKLKTIVYNRDIKTTVVNATDYDSAGWAFKQAHLNGKSEAFREILKLLED